MKFINWVLKKLIARERKKQIKKGYTIGHDVHALLHSSDHLINEALSYYGKGNNIAALALLEAEIRAQHAIGEMANWELEAMHYADKKDV